MPIFLQLVGLFCLGFVSIGGELREGCFFVFNNQREGREGREGEKRGKAHNNKSKRERGEEREEEEGEEARGGRGKVEKVAEKNYISLEKS